MMDERQPPNLVECTCYSNSTMTVSTPQEMMYIEKFRECNSKITNDLKLYVDQYVFPEVS